MAKKGNIRIETESNWWDCEDCGTIVDETLRIYHDGQKIVELQSDGHFGDGDDLSDVEGILEKVLGALDYSVTRTESDYDNGY